MDDLVGAPSLDDAWLAFTAGDIAECTARLTRRADVLAARLCTPTARRADAWTSELAELVEDAFFCGLLARKVGALACAARAQRAALLATWPAAQDAGTARWFQTAASCELALVDLARNRGTVGLGRLRSLRQQLIDVELQELLIDEPDVGEPAIERLDDQIEYLESELGLRHPDAIRPTYATDPAPPADPSAPPSDIVPATPEPPRGAWPGPLERIEPEPTLREGLAQLGDLNHATWRHIYEGREATTSGRHDASLQAFDRAIQAAELVAATFLGSWEARRVLAVAIVGRSGALEELELADRSLEDLALAAGILADLADAFPEVIELRTDEAWAVGVESWRRVRLHQSDDAVIERSQHAVDLLERARNTAVRERDDLLSMIWLLSLSRRHYRKVHAYRALAANLLHQERLASELAAHYYEQSRDLWNELLDQVPGRFGAFLRWLMGLAERQVLVTSSSRRR